MTEYRLHRLTCPGCGTTTCGTLPEGVPTGHFGPYLQAVLATLAGAYRLSKRQIQQLAGDLFGLSISTGMISKLERQSAEALEAPYNELAAAVHTAEVIHADETSWREDRRKAWLWVAVTALSTVFTIARNRTAAVAQAVLGTHDGPIAVTDRCSSYDWIAGDPPPGLLESSPPRFPGDDRPWRGGRADRPTKLLRLSDRLFRWWHRLEAEEVDRERFRTAMARLRREVKAALEDGCAVRLRDDEGDLRRDPAGRGEPVDLRAGGGGPADEQRGGARRAARGDLAADQRGHGQRAGEPVRGADADGGGHVPAAGAERAGLPDIVLRGGSERPSDPLPLAGDSTEDQSRLIPAISPYEPARRSFLIEYFRKFRATLVDCHKKPASPAGRSRLADVLHDRSASGGRFWPRPIGAARPLDSRNLAVRKVEDISEAEMIAIFLKTELFSERFRQKLELHMQEEKIDRRIIERPDWHNASENSIRRNLLGVYAAMSRIETLFPAFLPTCAGSGPEFPVKSWSGFDTSTGTIG